jgi:acid phosphatase family membrane protein YuiD
MNFFYEHLYLIPAITFIVAVLCKLIYIKSNTWEFNIQKALWSGGMPSVHSAIISSLAAAVALKSWINSESFAIAITVAIVIIYDAINVRYEAWIHAKALNEILRKNKIQKLVWKDNFKEYLGHLPREAFAWSVLGVIVAIFIYFI